MSSFDPKKLLVVDLFSGNYPEKNKHERLNLERNKTDGRYYGYCPPKDKIIIKKLDAKRGEDSVGGILVVYVKKKETSADSEREIIAFCENATVYGRPQSDERLKRVFKNEETGERITATYSIESEDQIKVDEADRMPISNIIGGNRNARRFRGQRFYGSEHLEIAKEIIASIEKYKALLDDDDEYLGGIHSDSDSEPATDQESEGAADRELNIALGRKGEEIKKDGRLSKAALEREGYKCQCRRIIDLKHETFKTEKNVDYMEGHHLIPCTVKNAKDFKNEGTKGRKYIDCPANIVCICPNCHRAVHYGNRSTRKKIIEILYEQQAEALEGVGIKINLKELLELYKL